MAIDLEELRAQVAAEDAAEADKDATTEKKTEAPPQAAEARPEVEAAKTETDEPTEVVEPKDGETEDVEDWMTSSDEPAKEFTSRDIKAAKTNLRAKLERQHSSEVEQLKAENEQLKKGRSASPQTEIKRPRREDFFESDDPDQSYDDAALDYTLAIGKAERSAEMSVRSRESQNSNKQEAINKAVDGHYERAAALTEKSGINSEAYKQADLTVREMVDSIYPDSGDNVIDELISLVGEGSERVIYNLGVNKSRLNELREKLSTDKSGMSAVAYLASLNVKLNRSVKPTNKAPAPAGALKGDKARSDDMSSLKMAYDAAAKGDNMQAALDAKQAARRGGIDTTQW